MKADDERAAIAAEAALIEKNANYASEAQFATSNLWRTVQLWVTIPAAVLAAIAGGTALATTAGRLVAGCMALAAAALSATSAALGAPSRVAQHQSAGSGFLALRNAARVFTLVDLPLAPAADARAGLASPEARHDEISSHAVLTPRLAWWPRLATRSTSGTANLLTRLRCLSPPPESPP
jgi:hypothetical protein